MVVVVGLLSCVGDAVIVENGGRRQGDLYGVLYLPPSHHRPSRCHHVMGIQSTPPSTPNTPNTPHPQHPQTSPPQPPPMAPITTASNDTTHHTLLNRLDTSRTPKPFRNPHFHPPARRNKPLKQLLSESQRSTPTPTPSYAALAAAPSRKPKRKYCDITGVPARYRDAKTGLRVADMHVARVVRAFGTARVQELLALRAANTVLK